jgi:hypothetical protein
MFNIMLALHLLTAIFAIGPLVWAAKTAGRGVRRSDSSEITVAIRTLRWYSIASVLVVIFGFALMSSKDPDTHKTVASFSDPYIWISLILWAVAIGLIHGMLMPQLEKIRANVEAGESASAVAVPVAVLGGLISVIFVVIVFLMVYKPGS